MEWLVEVSMQTNKKVLFTVLFSIGSCLFATDSLARGGAAVRADVGTYNAGGDHDFPPPDEDYDNHPVADQDYDNHVNAVDYAGQADFVPYAAGSSTVENVYVAPTQQAPQTQGPQVVVAGQPQQMWVAATNGQVPDGAVVNTSNRSGSNQPTYYCQAVYGSQTLSGVLVPNDGCFVQQVVNGPTIRVTSYNVLVSQTSS
jgi:hypothetical protein